MPAQGAQQGRASTASTPETQRTARTRGQTQSPVTSTASTAFSTPPAPADEPYYDARIVAHRVGDGYEYVGLKAPAAKGVVADEVFNLPQVNRILHKSKVRAQLCVKREWEDVLAHGEYRYRLTEAAAKVWEQDDVKAVMALAAQLAAFLTTMHGVKAKAAGELVAQDCNFNGLDMGGSLVSITVPSSFPNLDDFEPQINGETAECVVKGAKASPRYQTICLGTVTSSAAQQMLVEQLCDMVNDHHVIVQELWRWLYRDSKGSIVAQTGDFTVLLDLHALGVTTEAEAFRVMNNLPGWVDLGYDVVELQYMYRFDHCDVCKLNADPRHTSDDCPKKWKSEHAHKRRRCIATDEDDMLSVQQEHVVKDDFGLTSG